MSLAALIREKQPVTAPLVLNPLMARMAEAAGFKAAYLGGGALGYMKACFEANLNLTEICQAATDIRSVARLSLIMDGACGYGDPMHLVRTVGMAESVGFEAIEIEDQIMPKRAHHHIGIEHMVPAELMVDKIEQAVRARRSADFLIIGRTNAVRVTDMDDTLRRGEAYRRAGADILFPALTHDPEQLRRFAERLGGPLMFITGRAGLAGMGMTLDDMGGLGYKLIVECMAPLIAAYDVWKKIYDDLADGFGAGIPEQPHGGPAVRGAGEKEMLSLIGLDELLAIERATVERP